MTCDVCQNHPATVYLTQIVDGKMLKVNLCEACSKEKGVSDPTGFALADLLLGLGASEEISSNPAEQRCPACGFSQNDFKKTGRLGCSVCYDTFAEGLGSLIKAMHKGPHHVGKVPARLERTLVRDARIRQLREELEEAVSSENYETAAQLRDELRELEHQP